MTASRIRLTAVLALALAAVPLLSACSAADNMVSGAVSEAQGQIDDAVTDAQGELDKAVSEALGGAGITTDGKLPSGFPTDDIPLVGDVLGGGSGPDSSGWVVRTELSGDDDFAAAQAALEDAGYEPAAVNADADSGFGTFTLTPYTVVLTVTTDDAVSTATYVVTKP